MRILGRKTLTTIYNTVILVGSVISFWQKFSFHREGFSFLREIEKIKVQKLYST